MLVGVRGSCGDCCSEADLGLYWLFAVGGGSRGVGAVSGVMVVEGLWGVGRMVGFGG